MRRVLTMVKFSKILNGRPAGREASLRVRQIFNDMKEKEIYFDFNGVEVLTPSFADEFFKGIKQEYPDKRIKILGADSNPNIKNTLEVVGINPK